MLGARPDAPCAPATFVELVEWGLIGPNDGLTDRGSAVRTKLVNDAIDAI